MSLTERVARAATADPQDQNPAKAKTQVVTQLKSQIKMQLDADNLATLAVENPQRARNEVRAACRIALAGVEWSAFDELDQKRLVEEVIDSVFGFGPLESLIADETVTEIMVNGASSVYYERKGKLFASQQVFDDESQVRAIIDKILGPIGRRIDEASPMVNARLAQGHRVNAIIPPLSLVGPVLTIRKFTEHVITLEEMEGLGSIDSQIRLFLEWAVKLRKNLAVSGGTGSGKTTLLNALSCVISHDERIITIEDSAELRFLEHPHVVRLEARPRNAEGLGEITIRDLVVNALRMRPDRIVVGEVRGSEALDMLQAMTTGHDGSLTTLHADSPREVVSRLTTMVRYDADLPVDVVESYIASALDIIVQTARALDGSRFVSDIVGIGIDADSGRCSIQPFYSRGLLESQGHWASVPEWIDDIPSFGYATESEVSAWKRSLR